VSFSVIAGSALQLLDLFTNNGSTKTANKGASTSPASSTDSSGSVDLSQAAQFFSKLQNLSQTAPARFKQLTAKISSELQTAAQSATGSDQTFLSNLANRFKTASQTGNPSTLHHNFSFDDTSSSVIQNIFQQV
jgi:hypothetical protein